MSVACYLHPERFATATCAECERPICADCTPAATNRPICSPCVAAARSPSAAALSGRPSAIPVNVPRAASGIPVNVPRGNGPTTPPAYGGMPAQGMPAAQPLGSSAPYAPAPGAAPLLGGGSYAPAPQSQNAAPPLSAAPQVQPLYAPPGAAPMASTAYGQPAPNQPTAYSQPGAAPYSPPSSYGQPGYLPISSQSGAQDEPNITIAVVVGIVTALVVGGGFGAASLAIGMRMPFLSILVGLIVGHAVKAAAKTPSHAVGIIGGVCSLLSCGVTYGMLMLLTTYQPSAIALLLLFYATWRGYRIGSGVSSW